MIVTMAHMTVTKMSTWNNLSNSGKVIDFVSFSYEPNVYVFKEPRLSFSTILCCHGHTDHNGEIGRKKTYGHAALKGVVVNALMSN